MTYQLDPTRLRRTSGRRVLGLAALATVALAGVIGIVTVGSGGPAGVGGSADVGRSPSIPAALASTNDATATPAPTSTPTPALADLTCHDLPQPRCRAIAAAALAAIADPTLPPAGAIEVWPSLLCDDTLDCPSTRLSGHQPAGSAVIAFGPSLELWVDVTTHVPIGPGAGLRYEAWVIRSRTLD